MNSVCENKHQRFAIQAILASGSSQVFLAALKTRSKERFFNKNSYYWFSQ